MLVVVQRTDDVHGRPIKHLHGVLRNANLLLFLDHKGLLQGTNLSRMSWPLSLLFFSLSAKHCEARSVDYQPATVTRFSYYFPPNGPFSPLFSSVPCANLSCTAVLLYSLAHQSTGFKADVSTPLLISYPRISHISHNKRRRLWLCNVKRPYVIWLSTHPCTLCPQRRSP